MKLAYSNNWEALTFYDRDPSNADAHKIATLEKVEIGGKDYPVVARTVSVGYMDHGHSGAGTSTHYFVKLRLFGKWFDFALHDLLDKKITIKLLKYTLEPK